MRELIIADRRIADDEPPYVIAEIGHNHNGNAELCKEMIRQAKAAGADAVKLQKRTPQTLYTKEVYSRPFRNEHAWAQTYGQQREFEELDERAWHIVKRYARYIDMPLIVTPFGMGDVDFLATLGVNAFKIASASVCNLNLIQWAAGYKKPVIISTGGANLSMVRRAYDQARQQAMAEQAAILQCTVAYPTRHENLNLRVIETYRQEFPEAVIGLSCHNPSWVWAVVAYMLGARIFEFHFTLGPDMQGTDHEWSLTPDSLASLTRTLRQLPYALGDGVKALQECEKAALKLRRMA